MSLSLATLEEKLRQIKKCRMELAHSLHTHGDALRRAMASDPERPPQEDYTFRDRGHSWRCQVRLKGNTTLGFAMVFWFHGPKVNGRFKNLDAILLRQGETALHFDTHFFERWGQRTDLITIKLTNLMGFFRQYPHLRLHDLGRTFHGNQSYATAIEQGLVYARKNGNKLFSCDTFISEDMMEGQELALWQRLRAKEEALVVHTR